MKKRIVVIEDDPGVQDVLQIILQHEGYQVEVMETGNRILQEGWVHPDVYLLDIMLRGSESGLAICHHLKSAESTVQIPVVIFSALTNVEEMAKEAGADAVLEKPFTVKRLKQVITKVLN